MQPTIRRAALVVGGTALAAGAVAAPAGAHQTTTTVSHHTATGTITFFAHRGAPGYRPEHTLAGYALAIKLGADYIEPDLVSTKDGVLIARHENEIGGTTNVADHPEFADRKTTKVIDGNTVTGWFTEDFTLKEIKTLRAKERLPSVRPGNTQYDGLYEIPTFDEVLALAKKEGGKYHRTIGVSPETKHPTYFRSIGLSLEGPMLRSLTRAGLNDGHAKVVIQSFETSNLRKLSRQTRIPLVQLTSASGSPYDHVVAGDPGTYADMMSPAGLKSVAKYADWIGPDKNSVIPRDSQGFLKAPTPLVEDAHAAGLKVVAYTFREENQFLPADFRIGTDPNAKGDIFGELKAYFAAGLDGFFADYPDTADAARDWWESQA